LPTWHQVREAEKAAWSAPGVVKVRNKIIVEEPFDPPLEF
jgi:hypothetical protein